MQFAKGYVGARWLASDPNGDSMIYTVEIRGVSETEWKPLKDKVAEKYYLVGFHGLSGWRIPPAHHGVGRARESARGGPDRAHGERRVLRSTTRRRRSPDWPPRATGGKLEVRWHAADALNNITKAEYSLDGGEWTVAAPVTKLSDSLDLDYDLTIDAGPGEHTIAVRVEDDYENLASDKVVVGV